MHLVFLSGLGWHRKSFSFITFMYQSFANHYKVGSYMAMGISKLPADIKPERWELIFYIVCTQKACNATFAR